MSATQLIDLLESFAGGGRTLDELRKGIKDIGTASASTINECFDYLDEATEAGELKEDDRVQIEELISDLSFGDDVDHDDTADITRFDIAIPDPTGDDIPEDATVPRLDVDQHDATQVTPSKRDSGGGSGDEDFTGELVTTGQTGTGTSASSWKQHASSGNSKTPVTGDILKERFVLEKRIGKGGMGTVYRAKDLRKEEAQDRNPYLAIKILNEDFKNHPDALKALQREARKSQSLAHPNVVNVFDFDRDGDVVYMTMELMEGFPLDRVIKRSSTNPLTPKTAMHYIRQMAEGLAYAHSSGIVHSDFKPGNVFLNGDGTIKVLDFGIARASTVQTDAVGDETLFDAKTLGALTPAYASPEMLDGQEPTPADDVYALGCVAYELLTGNHPFTKMPANEAKEVGLTPQAINKIQRNQWRAIASALAFDPAKRIASADEFLLRLDQTWQKKYGVQVSLALAGSILAISLALYVPPYLEARDLNALRDELRSNDEDRITVALETASQLEPEKNEAVLSDVSNELLGHFSGNAKALFDPQAGALDYPAASAQLKQAEELYQFNDAASQLIASQVSQLEDSKNRLLSQLDTEFNNRLRDFEELDLDAQGELLFILEQLEIVSPGHPTTTDRRLPPAAVSTSRQLTTKGEFDTARKVINAFLPRFPESALLLDQLDKIDEEETRVARAVQVFLKEAELASARQATTTVQDLSRLGKAIASLSLIDPGNSELSAARDKAGVIIADSVNVAFEQQDWDQAASVISDHSRVMTLEVLNELRALVATKREQWRVDISKLLNQLHSTANPPGPGQLEIARASYEQLQVLNPGELELEHARAYLRSLIIASAHQARVERNVDRAAAFIEDAAGLGNTRKEAQQLEGVLAAIRDGSAGSSGTNASAIAQRLNTKLAQPEFSQDDIRLVLDDLQSLALAAPSHPLVYSGREELGTRLARGVTLELERQNMEGAEKLALDYLGLLPDSKDLLRSLRATRYQIGLADTAATQRELKEELGRLEQFLDDPSLTSDWYNAVSSRLERLEYDLGLPMGDSSGLRRRIAELYAQRAADARADRRFTEARQLVSTGRTFDAEHERWSYELNLIAISEEASRRELEMQARNARIDAIKQTFWAQARALEVDAAEETLNRLREVSPDDAFLVTIASSTLTGSYVELVDKALAAADFNQAISITQKALERYPNSPALIQLLDRAKLGERKASIVAMLSGRAPLRSDIDEVIDEIRLLAPENFDANVEEILAEVGGMLDAMAETNPTRAKSLRTRTRAVFSGIALSGTADTF